MGYSLTFCHFIHIQLERTVRQLRMLVSQNYRITWGKIAENKDTGKSFANDKYSFLEATEFGSGAVTWLTSRNLRFGGDNTSPLSGFYQLPNRKEAYIGVVEPYNDTSSYVEGIAPTKSFTIRMRGFLDVKDFKFDKEETINLSTPITLSAVYNTPDK